MKERIYIVLIGLLSVWLGAAAETDTRTEVTEVVATSNIADIICYGQIPTKPLVTMKEGSVANIPQIMASWQKKNADGEWKRYSEPVITEGTYCVYVQVRVDGDYGLTHKLVKGYSLIIDNQQWTTGTPWVKDTYSYDVAVSPEFVVHKEDIPLTFKNSSGYEIPDQYVGKAIKEFSVAGGAAGGESPYTFSKTAGPDWIIVKNDGMISGTPNNIGTNPDLVVRVTDKKSAYKEITISVGETFAAPPEDRTDVSVVTGTSDIAKIIGYGKKRLSPAVAINENQVVNLPSIMTCWEKQDTDGKWKNYSGSTFTEGLFRVCVQVRIEDSNSKIYKLADDWSMIVDGITWTTGIPVVKENYSYAWAFSPDIFVSDGGKIIYFLNELTLTGPSAPIPGIIPKDDVSLGANVDISDNSWEVCDGGWMKMDKNELDGTYLNPFEKGKKYMYYLTARPTDGFEFAPGLKVLYNGKEIPDWDMDKEYSTFKMIENDGSMYIEIGSEDLTGSAGISSVVAENGSADVYNMQGVLVKRNATAEDLRSLHSGIYITRGKKLIVK